MLRQQDEPTASSWATATIGSLFRRGEADHERVKG
jgi:hypothetical protein